MRIKEDIYYRLSIYLNCSDILNRQKKIGVLIVNKSTELNLVSSILYDSRLLRIWYYLF